jgi:hypothetical protein
VPTLDAHLRAALPGDEHSALLPTARLDPVLALAARLPSSLGDFFGFECRLGTRDGAVDWLVCVRPDGGGRDVLARLHETHLPAAWRAHPSWRRIFDFAARWASPESALADLVENVWLEFDAGTFGQEAPAPAVFFGARDLRAPFAGDRLDRIVAGLVGGQAMLRGSEADGAARGGLRRALAALPDGARIFQVGTMLSRSERGLRLCVRGLDARAMAEWLGACGWQGDSAALVESVGGLADAGAALALDVDVVETIATRIGVEVPLGRDTTPRSIESLAARLVARGVCDPTLAEALVSWPRRVTAADSPGWPRELALRAAFLGANAQSALVRSVHHVKLVFDPLLAEAKAYLAVEQAYD